MTHPLDAYTGNLTWLHDRTIFLVQHGSHAYGLNTPASDLDVKGIAVPPPEYFTGFSKHFEQAESKEPDLVIYNVRKFFELASKCNPNIIEVLFTQPEDHFDLGKWKRVIAYPLIRHRDLFLSQRAKHTFSGYAMAQLKRINGHYRWLKNPPAAPPDRAAYGLQPLAEMSPASRDQLGSALAMAEREFLTWHELEWTQLDDPQRIALKNRLTGWMASLSVTKDSLFVRASRSVGLDDNLIELLQKEKAWRSAKQDWDSYQTWKAERNEKRAELERRFGYDTKHAMHLVRLLRMCREIITGQGVIVKRPDREELLAIRAGAWKYEDLVAWAEKEDKELTALLPASPLPKVPPINELDSLCSAVVEECNDYVLKNYKGG